MAEGFSKVSDVPVRLTGGQKAAVLLAELGPAFEDVMKYFNQFEKKRLCSEMRRLGTRYSPNNMYEVAREQKVLNEAKEFGQFHGIWRNISKINMSVRQRQNEDVLNVVASNADKVASILSAWLSEDD